MNNNQDGEKIGKKGKKEAMTTFGSRTLGLFLVPGGNKRGVKTTNTRYQTRRRKRRNARSV